MLKNYVRHGMIVENFLEIISFRQSRGLLTCINQNTQKNWQKRFLKKISSVCSITHSMEKQVKLLVIEKKWILLEKMIMKK